jgi:hypothetical protein
MVHRKRALDLTNFVYSKNISRLQDIYEKSSMRFVLVEMEIYCYFNVDIKMMHVSYIIIEEKAPILKVKAKD